MRNMRILAALGLLASAAAANAEVSGTAAIVSDYDLEPVDLARLATACHALDRAEQAAAEVRRDGLLVTMPSGARRPHPAVRIEAESRALFLRSLRELDLDAEAIPEAVRPPSLRSIAGTLERMPPRATMPPEPPIEAIRASPIALPFGTPSNDMCAT